MEEVLPVESVDDVYDYVNRLWRLNDGMEGTPFDDEFYSQSYQALMDGVEDLNGDGLDVDVDEFEMKIIHQEYGEASSMIDAGKSYDSSPKVGHNPFSPGSL